MNLQRSFFPFVPAPVPVPVLVLVPALALLSMLRLCLNADEIDAVRNVFAAVDSAELSTESFAYDDAPTGSSGEVVQFTEPGSSRFRKLRVSVGVDDGGSAVAEFFLDEDGALRFVLLTREQYEYGDGGAPYLDASQLRIYFDADQNLLRALRKSARAASSDQLGRALDQSENREVHVAPIPARRIVDSVDELCRSLNPERAREAGQLSMAALDLFDEPEPPADKQEWVPVALENGKTYPADKFHHEIFNEIIAGANLPHPDAEAPAIHIFHTHRYPGDLSVSMLATADRLFHDSIDSVRYRMDIRESPGDEIEVIFFGYQIRPRSDSEEPRTGARDGWLAEKIPAASRNSE